MPVSPAASDDQLKVPRESIRLILWVALACSYPLWAVFEEENPLVVYIPTTCLAIGAIWSLRHMPAAAITSFALLLIAALTYYYALISTTLRIADEEKLYQFLSVMAVFGLFLALFLINSAVIRCLTWAFLITGVVSIALMAINPVSYQGRVSFGESNPIWIARILGLAGLSSFVLLLRHPKAIWLIAVLTISAIAIVLTGSRGPLLALISCIAFGLLMLRFQNKILYLSLSLLVVIFSALIINQIDLSGLRVFSIDAESSESSYLRQAIYEYSFYLMSQYPNGIGIGSFLYYGNIFYPHNVVVEVFVEWGWFCGLVFTSAILISFISLIRLGESFDFIKLLFVYDLINACLSGDITSPRFLYGLIIFGLALVIWRVLDLSSLDEFERKTKVSEVVLAD